MSQNRTVVENKRVQLSLCLSLGLQYYQAGAEPEKKRTARKRSRASKERTAEHEKYQT